MKIRNADNLCDVKPAMFCVKGFTLIEVLAAIAIFAILTALVMNVVAGSLMISKDTEIASRNVVLCSRKIDEIKAKILGRSTDPGYSYGWDIDYDETGAFLSPDAGYKYTVTDSPEQPPNPDYPPTLIRNIAVTVWYDQDGDSILDSNEKRITLNTKITKRD